MPFLQLQSKPYLSLDNNARQGISAFYDASKDDAMGNERRVGLELFADLGTGFPVDSVTEWETTGVCAAVSGGRLFKVIQNGTVTEITGAPMQTGSPAYDADFGSTLYLANGGRIVQWDGGTTATYIESPNAPVDTTHIGFVDQYLVALSNGSIDVSEAGDATDWQGYFFDAEASRDKTKAMMIGWREVVAFGGKTIEYFAATGIASDPFGRLEGTQTERGTIAAYSPAMVDNTWFFLDHERKVVRMVGRDPQIISLPIDRVLQKVGGASAARGFRLSPDGEDYYVLAFPDQTWAYDVKRDVWSQWSYFNNETGSREAFLGQSACYMRRWNKHLVGSRKDGKIYASSRDVYTDGGNPIVTEIWSGWENFGTDAWKTCPELRLKLRRGDGLPLVSPEPFIEVSYRDNGNTQWSTPRQVNLGQLGENEHIARVRQLGRYRTRQWRFRLAGNVPLVLVSAEVL